MNYTGMNYTGMIETGMIETGMIELQGITKLYGTVIGVNDISVSLRPGAHGLLGPNGAGKTTFLNLITGQLRPTQGRVRVFGANPRRRGGLLKKLGVCPGDEALYANVSGFDWCRYLVELHGLQAAEAADRAEQALHQVGMQASMHRAVGSYSRGMRQRTKLAQAIAHDPQLLILDEPFNGLDPVGRRLITDLLRDWTEQGKSLLMASHILHEVEAISPSFLLICGGRLLASGTADEISQLLADVPQEIEIDCDRPSDLAEQLLAQQLVEGIAVRGGNSLRISTRSPLRLFQALPDCIHEHGFRVFALRSTTESLQSLFDSLLNVHRGGIER